jgi:phospholipid/cholesterol/gamma-HCH transport system substrate-binding protein
MLRENIGEALVGLLVVILAICFVMFAWDRTGGGERPGSASSDSAIWLGSSMSM